MSPTTESPTIASGHPSATPTTSEPTSVPTSSPTSRPTSGPTAGPTSYPTSAPSNEPTAGPTAYPTGDPSSRPTGSPSDSPTHGPTAYPTSAPSSYPTEFPSAAPTKCVCEQGCFPADDVPATLAAARSLNEEKAFAYDSNLANCYISDEVASSSETWGWAIGPLSEGSHRFPIYALVDGCDAGKGTQIGVLHFDFNSNGATAKFVALDGIALLEAHFNIGATKYPKKEGLDSVSPAQFTSKHERFLADSTTDTFKFSHFPKNSNGDIFIIARTVVSGEETQEVMDRNGCVCVCPSPTAGPTSLPTSDPTAGPTTAPTTSSPTAFPTEAPSAFPTEVPSSVPTAYPTSETGETNNAPDDPSQGRDLKVSAENGFSNEAQESSVECRSAFAYHSSKASRSFQDLGFENDGIVGWSNGPFAASSYAYSLEMYAGELPVATVSMNYDDDEVEVTIDAGERLWLKSVHAYVGHSPLPVTAEGIETIDPVNYPVAHDRMSLSRSFAVSELDGTPVYFVAEATVCGVFEAPEKHIDEDGGLKNIVSNVQGYLKNLF